MAYGKGGKVPQKDGGVGDLVAFIAKQFPIKTAQAFEAATGISGETYRKWRDGVAAPSYAHLRTMQRVFGLAFAAILAPENEEIVMAALRSERDAMRAEIAARHRRLAEIEARVSGAFED